MMSPLRAAEGPAKKMMRNRSRTLNALVYCLIILAVCLGGIAAWRRYSLRRRPDEIASEPGDAARVFRSDSTIAHGLLLAGGPPTYAPPPANDSFVCPQCQSRCLVPAGGGSPACPFCGRSMARQTSALSPVGGLPVGRVGVRRWSGAGRPVGGVVLPPVIGTNAIRPHGDKGLCTTCHTISASSQGLSISFLGGGRAGTLPCMTPVGLAGVGVASPIPIRPNAVCPHVNRGVCTNCHTVVSSRVPLPQASAPPAALPSAPFRVQLAAAAPVRPNPAPLWRGVAAPAAVPGAAKPTLIKQFGIEVSPAPGSGARVTGVMGNSYAANSGLRAGDIIIECNGARVRGVEQFQQLVTRATPEADAQIRIMRAGRARDLLIMVGEGEMEGFTPIRPL